MVQPSVFTPRMHWFHTKMYEKMALPKNVSKGDWLDGQTTMYDLLDRLYEEAEELEEAIEDSYYMTKTGTTEAIVSECCDVANFAMMIADLAKTRASTGTVKPPAEAAGPVNP